MARARIPREFLERLKEARAASTMERASFGFPDDRVMASLDHLETPAEHHPDHYIKEMTQLYRQTWITAPLDAVIAWAERKPKP